MTEATTKLTPVMVASSRTYRKAIDSGVFGPFQRSCARCTIQRATRTAAAAKAIRTSQLRNWIMSAPNHSRTARRKVARGPARRLLILAHLNWCGVPSSKIYEAFSFLTPTEFSTKEIFDRSKSSQILTPKNVFIVFGVKNNVPFCRVNFLYCRFTFSVIFRVS